jgi:hypothetical protein
VLPLLPGRAAFLKIACNQLTARRCETCCNWTGRLTSGQS